MAGPTPTTNGLDPAVTAQITQLGTILVNLKGMTPEKLAQLTKDAKTLADQQQILQTLTASLQATGVSLQNIQAALQGDMTAIQLQATGLQVGGLLKQYHLTSDEMSAAIKDGTFADKFRKLLDDPTSAAVLGSLFDTIKKQADASSAPFVANAAIADSIAKSQLYTDLAKKGNKRTGAEEMYFQQLEAAKGQAAAQVVNSENYAELMAKPETQRTFAEQQAIKTYEKLVADTDTSQSQAGMNRLSLKLMSQIITPDGHINLDGVNGNGIGTGSFARESAAKVLGSVLPRP